MRTLLAGVALFSLVGCGVSGSKKISTENGEAIVSKDGSLSIKDGDESLTVDKDGNYNYKDAKDGSGNVSGDLKGKFSDSVFVLAIYPGSKATEYGSVETKMGDKTMYARVWTSADGVNKIGQHFLDEAKKHGKIVGGDTFVKLNDDALVIPVDLKSGNRCQVHVTKDPKSGLTSISMHFVPMGG